MMFGRCIVSCPSAASLGGQRVRRAPQQAAIGGSPGPGPDGGSSLGKRLSGLAATVRRVRAATSDLDAFRAYRLRPVSPRFHPGRPRSRSTRSGPAAVRAPLKLTLTTWCTRPEVARSARDLHGTAGRRGLSTLRMASDPGIPGPTLDCPGWVVYANVYT